MRSSSFSQARVRANFASARPAFDSSPAVRRYPPHLCFGGSLLNGNSANGPRPLEIQKPIHVVLKATQGVLRLPQTFLIVEQEIARWAKLCDIRIIEHANVHDHLHLAIRIKDLGQWRRFIRGLTGSIARKLKVLGLCAKGKFWRHRPYTRVLCNWRKEFERLIVYIRVNQREGAGLVRRKKSWAGPGFKARPVSGPRRSKV